VRSLALRSPSYNLRWGDGIGDDVPITAERRFLSFEEDLRARIDAGFDVVEAGDWAGVAVWCVTACPKRKKVKKAPLTAIMYIFHPST
jgi:hypothetical protein